ncbi:hypothetical protein QR98_0050500 [Sarcoptes scabiei]|uniref:Uncharacterized protein n=1 Tax=Sarcoptes scabiei TaxID=52283 RepID=A0A132A6H3_SARSC|nr:hypothetical protein QR98_0050500 [Sarcoptes scabiei]
METKIENEFDSIKTIGTTGSCGTGTNLLNNRARTNSPNFAEFNSEEINANNSMTNRNLRQSYTNENDPQQIEPDTSVDECLNLFKACCKKKADFGLEDIFWMLFLLIIIICSIMKGLTRYSWSQITYMMFGTIGLLILLYIGATIFNKFVLEDSSTAHWNAHARYTQAAIHSRLNDEEQRVHVIAPPKMGGAKLNIIYSVGDVPLVKTASSGSSSTINGNPCGSRQGSVGSGLGLPNALSNLTHQAIHTATALLGNFQQAQQSSTTFSSSSSSNSPLPTTPTLPFGQQQSQSQDLTASQSIKIATTTSATSSSSISSTSTTIKHPSHLHYNHHHSHQIHSIPSSKLDSSTLSTSMSASSSSTSSLALSSSIGSNPLPLSSLKDEIIAEEEDRPETPSVQNLLNDCK